MRRIDPLILAKILKSKHSLKFKTRFKHLRINLRKIKYSSRRRFILIKHNKKIRLCLSFFQRRYIKTLKNANSKIISSKFSTHVCKKNLKIFKKSIFVASNPKINHKFLKNSNPFTLQLKRLKCIRRMLRNRFCLKNLGKKYFVKKKCYIFRRKLFNFKKKILFLKKKTRRKKKVKKKSKKKSKKVKKLKKPRKLKIVSFFTTCNLYNKFLFFIFKVGKKSVWENKFVSLFDLLALKLQYTKSVLLLKIFTRLLTRVETKKVKSRKRINYVPFFIKLSRSIFLSLKWIFSAALKKKGNISFSDKLFMELVQIITQRSSFAIQRRQENNSLAFKNRSNSHYRWQKTR